MSQDKLELPVSPKDSWTTWREEIKNPEPEKVGTGVVTDRGLYYRCADGAWATVWESTVDDLDRFLILLNGQGITKIHRAYRFNVEGNFPGPTLATNAIATKTLGWPVKLKTGDNVDIYAYRSDKYTQIAFKQKGG